MNAKQVPLHELLSSIPADARLVIDDPDGKGTRFIPVGRYCQEAAAALAEFDAEPTKEGQTQTGSKQEPVAWLSPRTVDAYSRSDLGYETCSKTDYGAFPVYTNPAPQRRPHELLCVCGCIWQIRADGKEALVATTPQRQPLTGQDYADIYEQCVDWDDFARAIEHRHGIGEPNDKSV